LAVAAMICDAAARDHPPRPRPRRQQETMNLVFQDPHGHGYQHRPGPDHPRRPPLSACSSGPSHNLPCCVLIPAPYKNLAPRDGGGSKAGVVPRPFGVMEAAPPAADVGGLEDKDRAAPVVRRVTAKWRPAQTVPKARLCTEGGGRGSVGRAQQRTPL
jgi:hypothetical protein